MDMEMTPKRGLLSTKAMSTVLSTPDRSFVVDGNFGQINLAELDLSALPSAHGDVLNEGLEQVNSIAAMSNPATARAVTGPVNIQVLAMYTPDARDDAGGQAALDALIQASMDSLNSATADSDIGSITFGLAGSQLLNGFSPGPTPEDARNALRALRLNNVVRTARDNTLADIVITFVKDVSAPGGAQLAACGNAFVQNQECSPGVTGATCGVGTAFEDFAYGWVSVECATLPNLFSFAHEVGHIMGSEHQRDESCWLGSGACGSNPPDIASFDFAYAAFDSFGADRFQTLMGAFPALVAPPQFVQFSNEEVLINGQASGVAGEAENAETVSTLAPIVEGFREETPIFSDGFESI